jgi:hypothetical protein
LRCSPQRRMYGGAVVVVTAGFGAGRALTGGSGLGRFGLPMRHISTQSQMHPKTMPRTKSQISHSMVEYLTPEGLGTDRFVMAQVCYLHGVRPVADAHAASSKLGSMDGKKKGKWDRRRRRWIPNEVSPDYRSMVLDDTYDDPKPADPFRDQLRDSLPGVAPDQIDALMEQAKEMGRRLRE